MSAPTFRLVDAGIEARLPSDEVDLLTRLVSDLRGLLIDVPEGDPVIDRLFGPTVSGDEEADGELRRLIHDDLLEQRLAAADVLLGLVEGAPEEDGDLVVVLDDDEAVLFLGVVNDVRLAIGARIGPDRLARRRRSSGQVGALFSVMDHLAYWQECLIEAMDPASTSHYDGAG